jgi:Family of unknown function (DUF6573)
VGFILWEESNMSETNAAQGFWQEADLISSYSRAQAIEDGVLVDVTATAKEAGIRFPVALTRAVWSQCVEVPAGVQGQDESGRLWDVLWMFRQQARRTSGGLLTFTLYVRNSRRVKLDRRDIVTLKAVCGPGDTAEPVITIMLPDED